MDIIIMSYDDPTGLEKVLRLCLNTSARKIIIAYGNCTPDSFITSGMNEDRLVLLREEVRLGKAASLDRALKYASSDYIAVMSSDIEFNPDFPEKADAYFEDKVTGAVVPSVEPFPVKGSISGAGRLLWALRDKTMQHIDSIKGCVHGGELLILRREAVCGLPDIVNDEEYLCLSVEKSGFAVRFASDIVIRNLVPKNFQDFLLQRERVLYGHREMVERGLKPPVLDFMLLKQPLMVARILFRTLSTHIELAKYLPLLAILETVALIKSKSYGMINDPSKWEFAKSTKS